LPLLFLFLLFLRLLFLPLPFMPLPLASAFVVLLLGVPTLLLADCNRVSAQVCMLNLSIAGCREVLYAMMMFAL
jgi:hypothetical protein